jgi:hypothetical protein
MSDAFENPLKPVPRAARLICGLVMGLFSCGFVLAALWMAADMLTIRSLAAPGKSLWGLVAVVGGIGLLTRFIAWRLVRGPRSANGVTLLPVAFLQGFGWRAAAAIPLQAI